MFYLLYPKMIFIILILSSKVNNTEFTKTLKRSRNSYEQTCLDGRINAKPEGEVLSKHQKIHPDVDEETKRKRKFARLKLDELRLQKKLTEEVQPWINAIPLHLSLETEPEHPVSTISETNSVTLDSCQLSMPNYDSSWDLITSNKIRKFRICFLSFGLRVESLDDCMKLTNTQDQSEPLDLSIKASVKPQNEPEPISNIDSHRYLTREIEIDDQELVYISNMFKMTDLFEKSDLVPYFDTYINIHKEAFKRKKSNESVYCFFESLDTKDISYETLQKIYTLFIANKILYYNSSLECFTISRDRLPIHVFFEEFYVLIMWKLSKLDITIESQYQNEYKRCLIKEIKLFCIILDLYNDIPKHIHDSVYLKKLIAVMYYHVEKFRSLTMKYLTQFHSDDHSTSLYYLGKNMINIVIKDNAHSKIISFSYYNISLFDGPPSGTTRENSRKPRTNNVWIHTEYYYNLHFENYTKIPYYILAFTVDFASIFFEENIMIYVMEKINEARKTEIAVKSAVHTRIKNHKPFNNSVNDIMEFFIMLNGVTKSDPVCKKSIEDCKSKRKKILSRFEAINQQRTIVVPVLNNYRNAIIIAMDD